MALFSCESRRDYTLWAIIAGVVIGIITALLQITAVIAVTPAFLWVTLGVAVGYLAVLLGGAFASREGDFCRGIGSILSVLLAGILGTVLFSLVLLGIPFAATGVLGAIFAGLLLGFFSLVLSGTACLVNRLIRCKS
ncbi:MAG: hypothetical protein E7486_05230 [Ruminococcaceae bacterium]|nr:hypothetical protein [Oscillospiraceae bacterium]